MFKRYRDKVYWFKSNYSADFAGLPLGFPVGTRGLLSGFLGLPLGLPVGTYGLGATLSSSALCQW